MALKKFKNISILVVALLLCSIFLIACGMKVDPGDTDPDPEEPSGPNAPTISITINADADSLFVDEELTLTATVTSSSDEDFDDTVTWSVDKTSIATIDPESGVLTGVAEGTVVVTAKSNEDNTKTATKSFTVEAEEVVVPETPEYNISINTQDGTYLTLEDETLTLDYSVTPEDVDIVWDSDDESIATVADGVVTAVAEGDVTITATIVDENGDEVSDSVELSVARDEEHIKVLEFINKYQEWVYGFINLTNSDFMDMQNAWFAEFFVEYMDFNFDLYDTFIDGVMDENLGMSEENSDLLEVFVDGLNESLTVGELKDRMDISIEYMLSGLPDFDQIPLMFILDGDFLEKSDDLMDYIENEIATIKNGYEGEEINQIEAIARLDAVKEKLKALDNSASYARTYNLYLDNMSNIFSRFNNESDVINDVLNLAVFDYMFPILFGTNTKEEVLQSYENGKETISTIKSNISELEALINSSI